MIVFHDRVLYFVFFGGYTVFPVLLQYAADCVIVDMQGSHARDLGLNGCGSLRTV